AKAKSLPALSNETKEFEKKLGVQAQDLTVEVAALLDLSVQRGVLITDVAQGSVAMVAGIQRGDVITKANDQAIQSTHDLEALVQSKKTEPRIKLEVIKKGKSTLIVIDLPS
ncbi:MAG TPA: PDZ domain-containing protein, partial [Candidatus Binatia bacterium]